MSLEFIIFAIIFFAVVGSAAFAGLSAAPWLPTRRKDLPHLLREISIHPGDHVVELGSGTGTVLLALAKEHPNAQFVGYEVSILPYLISKLRLYASSMKNVQIKYKNLFSADLHDVNVVFFYLLNTAYPKLITKFQELPTHARVIIEAWPLDGIEYKQEIWPKEQKLIPLYIYEGSQFHKV